jgi:aminoglycoside phosphotransferase (APT) family kinase protein
VSTGPNGTWRLSGVVDVENAVAGDPLIDVAKTLLYSVGKSRAKRDGFLTGYGPIEHQGWEESSTKAGRRRSISIASTMRSNGGIGSR